MRFIKGEAPIRVGGRESGGGGGGGVGGGGVKHIHSCLGV